MITTFRSFCGESLYSYIFKVLMILNYTEVIAMINREKFFNPQGMAAEVHTGHVGMADPHL